MKTNTLTKMNGPKEMTSRTSQRGIGMVEVLVAMVLLAIGVLGYAALQVRAVEATGEAMNRSQAIVILRGLAERIRVNNTAQGSYQAAVLSYANLSTAPALGSNANCYTATAPACTSAELATFDAFQTASAAFRLGIKVTMLDCPGVSSAPVKRQCLFASWGKTTLPTTNALPASSTLPTTTDCMLETGAYQPDATCIMMEAY